MFRLEAKLSVASVPGLRHNSRCTLVILKTTPPPFVTRLTILRENVHCYTYNVEITSQGY